MSLKKIKKLIKNPQSFFNDSHHPIVKLCIKYLRGHDKSIVSLPDSSLESKQSKESNDFDIWRAYRDDSWIKSNLNGNSLVVAICPLGIPKIDAERVQRLTHEAKSFLLPVWSYCAPKQDYDDLDYIFKKNSNMLGDVVRDLLALSLARGVTILALANEKSYFSRALAARARGLGMLVINDLPGYALYQGESVVEARLKIPYVDIAKPSMLAMRLSCSLAGVGGNDFVRLLVLPSSSFNLNETAIQKCLHEQVKLILGVCAPTDHLVIISKRRKNGLLNTETMSLLRKNKYRKTTLFYDGIFDFDALMDVAKDIYAPKGDVLSRWESDPRVTLYELDDSSQYLGIDPQVSASLKEALAARQTLWKGSPCDEREIILKKIIDGTGIDLVAVPDPISNSAITNGRQQHLNTLLNARNRSYGASNESAHADLFVQWGAEPSESKERPETLRNRLGIPRLYLEDGFIRSLGLWTNPDEPTCSIVMDTRSIYYDATKPSLLESILASGYQLTKSEIVRARGLIDAIVTHRISKYNYSPVLDLDLRTPGKKTILIVDQKVGDMSIKYGAASDDSFRVMLDEALSLGDDVEIVIKQHPCAINGDGSEAHFTKNSLGDILKYKNVHLIGFDINPYSLIEAVDEVWVVTSGMGFEALMAGKLVKCFGLPFYANWGLTHDFVTCDRRCRERSLEEVFHVFYLMLSRYVHPETGNLAPIECLIDYFSTQVSTSRR